MALSTAEPEVGITPSPAAAETSAKGPQFESWGRYPTYDARIVPLNWQGDFPAAIAGMHDSALPVGMGRSYGDVCLLKDIDAFLVSLH